MELMLLPLAEALWPSVFPRGKTKRKILAKYCKKIFERLCFKTVLFIVLLRCQTLGKTTNRFRESKVTRGSLAAIQTVLHLLKLPVALQRKWSFLFQRRISQRLWVVYRHNAECGLGDADQAWGSAVHSDLCTAFVSCKSYTWILFGQ